ncbi:hypothetical protein DY000_02047489 [Brassica cretica]|uniref:Uncharacterized protein n=1 Tax=Brassica cretica TaxID=69181 RepID=A0ABQ7ETJ3_BRACR|nr:hypothetical protein DY000_02047489 [Brassica cretica]
MPPPQAKGLKIQPPVETVTVFKVIKASGKKKIKREYRPTSEIETNLEGTKPPQREAALLEDVRRLCLWDKYMRMVHLMESVPKKKGRLVGLGRRTRSVPPSSAPPPFVDPEVLTAQLKDKDDRISLLETQMAAQQAGYEAQKRLNQQMMEMMYPNEVFPNEVFPNVQDP